MQQARFLLDTFQQLWAYVRLALMQGLRPEQLFGVFTATRKHLTYISEAQRRISLCRHDKIGQQLPDAVASVVLVEGVAVVSERPRPRNALKHVPNDLQKYTDQIYGGHVLAGSSQLHRLICTSKVGLVSSKYMSIARLQQPGGLFGNKAHFDFCSSSCPQHVSVQVHIATVHQKENVVGVLEGGQSSGQPFQGSLKRCSIEPTTLRPDQVNIVRQTRLQQL